MKLLNIKCIAIALWDIVYICPLRCAKEYLRHDCMEEGKGRDRIYTRNRPTRAVKIGSILASPLCRKLKSANLADIYVPDY